VVPKRYVIKETLEHSPVGVMPQEEMEVIATSGSTLITGVVAGLISQVLQELPIIPREDSHPRDGIEDG